MRAITDIPAEQYPDQGLLILQAIKSPFSSKL